MESDEDIPYDDDFEEVSEDEGLSRSFRGTSKAKTLQAAAHCASAAADTAVAAASEAEVSAKIAPSEARRSRHRADAAGPNASTPSDSCSPHTPSQGARPGRRRPQEANGEAARFMDYGSNDVSAAIPLSSGTGSHSGERPVRGKVSLTADREVDRPGTGGSSASHPSGVVASAGKPMWLQFDSASSKPPPRPNGHAFPAEPQQIRSGELRRQFTSNDPPGSRGSGAGDCGGGRRRPPGAARSNDGADVFGCEDRSGNAADADRKVKRMQQTIDRLTQRLKEAETFSNEDDGLPTFNLDEVDQGSQIAQGGFASVHHASWRSTPCALKKIFDPVITEELKADFENEVRMLRRLRHPNVVTLMAVCRVPPALSFLTEFVQGGSLFETLHGQGGGAKSSSGSARDGSTLPHVLQQASSALAYMHATEIVHRDVKSHNVLLCDNGARPLAKLCDFGLARLKSELCTGIMQWAGTAPYMALELFEKRRYTEAVDIYAFGVLLWEAAAGDIPHANMEAADIAERVKTKEYAGLVVPRSWPAPVRDLMRATLAAKFEDRPPMAEVTTQLRRMREFPNPLEG